MPDALRLRSTAVDDNVSKKRADLSLYTQLYQPTLKALKHDHFLFTL